MRKWLAFACGCVFLLAAGVAIYQKEQLLKHGQAVFLALAPVDPRSLMQGDYMALNFAIANQITREIYRREQESKANNSSNSNDAPELAFNHDGFAVLRLDAQGVAQLVRIEPDTTTATALAPGELRLRYRWRKHRIKLSTDAFFFQEGQGHRYATAKYGLFRVDSKGNALLSDLYDGEMKVLRESTQ